IQGVSESNTSSQQDQDCIVMPIWKDASYFDDTSLKSVDDVQIQDQVGTHDDCCIQDNGTDDQQVNTASPEVNTGSREVSTAVPEVNTATPEDLMGPIPTTEDSQMEDQDIELGNLSPSYAVSSTPHTRIHKDHPIDHVIGKTHQDLHTCLFACFLSQEEPKRVSKALSDPAWVEAMQEELLQFKLQNVWVLVDLPKGHRAIGTKWVYRNKKDERGIVIRNKARLVQQRKKGIFISQDKYVHEILRKFNYTDVKSASTPTDLEKPLVKDADADDVDEHLYRSMIGTLMYLTASRPDIMFAVCACARFQVSPKTSHLLAVKIIFRYLKGKPSLGLWYSKDSPLELVAYTDSDYAGATLDRKSTTGGCQFLGNRLISWQCKKQTVVATSTTEAEYVATASCCGQLADQDGITSIPTTEIFEQLALMGYHTDSDKLTFQKGAFSPQWRFLIHNILHCLSPKKTAWEQFSSNIATATICLATNRKFNFSRMIFEHMVSNISSPHKFLMYPRFIQICLDMQRHHLQQHSRIYPVPSLTMKVFSNMKRSTKGFSGQEVALFPNMLAVPTPSTSPSKITSSPSPTPSPSPEPTPTQPSPTQPSPTQPSPTQPSPTQPSPTQLSPTQPGTEHHPPTPHDSPLHAVHSHGSDEGSLKLQELMNLVTTLSARIGVLEADLMKTKKTYSSAYTKLILRVKKLEAQIKVGKARRQTRVVLSDTEVVEDDSSKQGRKFSDEGVQDDEGVHEKASTDTEIFVQEVTPTEVIQDQEGSEKASDEVSTAGAKKDTASEEVLMVSTAGAKKDTASEEVPIVSTAEVHLSTAGGTVTYSRRSAEKRSRQDKGKSIMIEEEPKKKSKKELEQERLSYAEAIRLEEQMNEEQRAQIARDEEIARQWDEEERKRAMDEAKSTKKIDWNDPSVIRYHTQKMKPKTVAQARRNMIKYLKNQGNYKITDFKGMSYNDIRPIFEKVWDFNQNIVPMDAEHGSEKQESPAKEKSPEKVVEEEIGTQEELKQDVKEPAAKRKKSIPRKSTRKRQKLEECEKDNSKEFFGYSTKRRAIP
ncbi:uncharacterized mitochondrial protein-like protein, partial [Tanacetum coccineum]